MAIWLQPNTQASIMKSFIYTEAQIPEIVPQVLEYTAGRKLFALTGEIGAGKTTFVKSICTHLGCEVPATSPTYAIVNEYAYSDAQVEKLVYHIDLYRLSELEETLAIGIEEYLYSDQYCFIEWPELIEDLLPEDTVRIKIELLPNSDRKIIIL